MRFLLEHRIINQCWDIYDMDKARPMEEPLRLCSIADSVMDKYIAAYLVSNGVLEVEKS